MFISPPKNLYPKILPLGLISLSLIVNPSAIAKYEPPPDATAPQEPTVSPTRGGCPSLLATTLTALAPFSHVGQTTSTTPTVAWFVPQYDPLNLEFSLYEYEGNKQKELTSQPVKLKSEPGIMSVQLPQLEVGKRYRWQVVLYCNPNRLHQNLVAGAELTVVAMPADLKARLAATNNPLEQANLYSEFGFWYDALASGVAQSEEQEAKDFTISLLEDLSRWEAASNSDFVRGQSVRLHSIVLTLGNPE